MAQEMRKPFIEELEKLLECSGAETPWQMIANALDRVPVRVLKALIYRVERARGEAFDDGYAHNKGSEHSA